jgi:nitrite reductase/ring-hydroxylating ferredoxin subunit
MEAIFVGRVEEFPDRGRKVVALGDVEVGVFRIDDKFYGWHNVCSHQGGPVCQGGLFPHVQEPVDHDGTVRALAYKEGSVNLVCPWHGYEFDLRTGVNPVNSKLRLRKAEVQIKDDGVYVFV